MGISDLKTILREALKPNAVNNVRMSYRDGGRQQLISFTLYVDNNPTDYEFIIPGGSHLNVELQAKAEELAAQLRPSP